LIKENIWGYWNQTGELISLSNFCPSSTNLTGTQRYLILKLDLSSNPCLIEVESAEEQRKWICKKG